MQVVSWALWICVAIDVCQGILESCPWPSGLALWQAPDALACPADRAGSGMKKTHFSNTSEEDDYTVDFEAHGFSPEGIPEQLPPIYLRLLNENSVVQLVNPYRQFTYISSGADAAVFLGVHVASGRKVVIKQFFERELMEIVEEAAVHLYLEQTGLFPRLLGLMPGGPLINNLSLVMEYVEDSECLWDMVDQRHALTPAQWLDVAVQICRALLTLHTKFVLHNDFHSSNILVQWHDSKPRVVLIDVGHATFRSSMTYSNKNGSIDSTRFYAPEIKKRQYTTLASDVFSLGYALSKINRLLISEELKEIVDRCMQHDPADRPSTREVLADVERLYEQALEKEGGAELPDLPFNPGFNYFPAVDVDRVYLPMILRTSTTPYMFDGKRLWLSDSGTDSIYVARLVQNGEYVVVKTYAGVSFEKIRHEAAVNCYLNSTGFIPWFVGIRPAGPELNDMSIVQEYFGRGVTMEDILIRLSERDDELRMQLALEVSRGVAAFHAMGVLINNIKVRDILVQLFGYRPHIRFIDLGQASVGKGVWISRDAKSLRNKEFLAPEIRNATSVTTWASDVYSMCLVLAEVVEESADQEVKDTMMRCLQVNPHLRPPAHEVAEYFAKVLYKYENL